MGTDSKPLRIAFFGTPDFAVPSLQAMLSNPQFEVAVVVTQPDRPAGRGQKLIESHIKQIAVAEGIPVVQPESIKRGLSSFLSQLETFGDLDFAVVVAFGQLLPLPLLQVPKYGSVNVHASLLPRWRGAAPIQRAIMAGDSKTGVCIMAMEEGLDTGAVFSKLEVPILTSTTSGSLHDLLANEGSKLLQETLPKIVLNQCPPLAQDSSGITYAKKVVPSEALIDWSLPSRNVLAHIHGLSPFPGAYTVWSGKRLKVYSCSPSANRVHDLPTGTVITQHGVLEVVCGDQLALTLQDVQFEGKKRTTGKEFLNGLRVKPEQLA